MSGVCKTCHGKCYYFTLSSILTCHCPAGEEIYRQASKALKLLCDHQRKEIQESKRIESLKAASETHFVADDKMIAGTARKRRLVGIARRAAR